MAAAADRRIMRIFVEGVVQGVGYRAFAQREALRLGLSGWARNRRDGRVETVVAGPAEAVEAFLLAARRGPPAGRVSGLQLEEASAAALAEQSAEGEFRIAPTL
jgi:acylphosphatase